MANIGSIRDVDGAFNQGAYFPQLWSIVVTPQDLGAAASRTISVTIPYDNCVLGAIEAESATGVTAALLQVQRNATDDLIDADANGTAADVAIGTALANVAYNVADGEIINAADENVFARGDTVDIEVVGAGSSTVLDLKVALHFVVYKKADVQNPTKGIEADLT